MTTEQLYEVLDSLPKGYGRKRICFAVQNRGIGSVSCQIGEMRMGYETFFCITSNNGGDEFHSVDELKFRLAWCRDAKIMFLNDEFWETPHTAECYLLEDGQCELDAQQGDDCGFIRLVFNGHAHADVSDGSKGEIRWFDILQTREQADHIMMRGGTLMWMPIDDTVEFPSELGAETVRGFRQLPHGSTCPRHGWVDGRHYVLKCGSFSKLSSDEHVHNECIADALLRTAGCLVPESWELHSDIGNGKVETLRLSRFIEKGSDLRPAFDNGSAEQRRKLISQIVDTYPAIAFIDGTDSYQHYALDNVLVDEDYNLWYIDNGASFNYRARGLTKGWFWRRSDPQDEEHGFYAVWKYASDSFKTIVQSVSKADLRKSAVRHDFVELVKTLPPDYQRPELLDYAEALNNWARGVSNNHSDAKGVYMGNDKTNKGGIMTKEDCVWLEAVSLRIAKMVRRIDKFIDEGKIARTATSRTAEKYAAEVDVARLLRLAAQDVSGRVDRLLGVCDDIANSAAAGYTMKVLADKWDRYADSTQRPEKKGNVDFSEYAFTRTGYEAAGGSVAPARRPARPTRPRKPSTNQQQLNIEVVCGNVEEIEADAVVNAANERLCAGSGICGAIFRRAGYAQLQAACDKVAPCPTGEARITPAFGITNAKYIIHAVGPVWYGGTRGEPQLLANCYRNLFKVAVENGCKSVAVPSISTGVFGYPLDEAIGIAVREAKAFVVDHPDFKAIFVAWAGGADGGKGAQAKYLKKVMGEDV